MGRVGCGHLREDDEEDVGAIDRWLQVSNVLEPTPLWGTKCELHINQWSASRFEPQTGILVHIQEGATSTCPRRGECA